MPRHIRFAVAAAILCVTAFAEAQEADEAVDGLTYREPFAGLSANEIRDKLVVFLITDEDPYEWTKARLEKADEGRLGVARDVWCGREFRRSFQKLFVNRPDLKDRCIAQRIVAGLPVHLTGGSPRSLPPRAIVAICDGNYRLLSFSVGVPDPDDLVYLIEDAQENLTLLNLYQDDAERLTRELLQRTRGRVRRVYRDSLTRLAERVGGDENLSVIDDAWIAKYVSFVSELTPSYLFDVKLRFGLSNATDRVRLIVLEQHCETRRDWCDTIAPYIVGRPMRDLMNPLVDTTWGIPAVIEIDPSRHDELLRWFLSRRDNATIVVSIRPTLLDQDVPWPPPNVNRRVPAKRDWAALETEMANHPFRTVSAEELAVVLNENDENPFHLLAPARARYIVFQPGARHLTVIRENDLPGKFIKRLEIK